MNKSVFVDSIGCEVQITRKAGLKNMRLTVHPENGVCMSIPIIFDFETAIHFINKKQNWIRKKLQVVEVYRNQYIHQIIDSGFRTHTHELEVLFNTNNTIKTQTTNQFIHIYFPSTWKIEDTNVQLIIRDYLKRTLVKEANQYIPDRAEKISQQHNLNYTDIRIGSAKTRWGSCRYDNRLTFSCYLMLMEKPLIDYIILHELSHTVHKNHGAEFYTLLNNLCNGEHKKLNLQIKQFRSPLTVKYSPQ
jgi:hypothetical protein